MRTIQNKTKSLTASSAPDDQTVREIFELENLFQQLDDFNGGIIPNLLQICEFAFTALATESPTLMKQSFATYGELTTLINAINSKGHVIEKMRKHYTNVSNQIQ